MFALLAAALLAPPPAPPVRTAGVNDCYTQYLEEGKPVVLDCNGLVLGTEKAATALDYTAYANTLVFAWPPEPKPIPWYDRPAIARAEGGLVVIVAVVLTVSGLNALDRRNE